MVDVPFQCHKRTNCTAAIIWSRQPEINALGERRADTRSPAGTAADAQGRSAASDPAAGEKGIDDPLFLGFYLVRAVELIVAARGFGRRTRHKDAPRFACAFNA